MTKNADFSPRPATKGCCTVAAEDKSLRLCFSVPPPPSSSSFFLLARSLVRRSLGSSLGVPAQPGSSRTPFWLGHRVLSLLALIYTTSGRIYWPQNTMRTCPCPSTETGSRPLVVYLFAVAIHIRPLRHVAAQKRRRERERGERNRGEENGTGLSEYFTPGRVSSARVLLVRRKSQNRWPRWPSWRRELYLRGLTSTISIPMK